MPNCKAPNTSFVTLSPSYTPNPLPSKYHHLPQAILNHHGHTCSLSTRNLVWRGMQFRFKTGGLLFGCVLQNYKEASLILFRLQKQTNWSEIKCTTGTTGFAGRNIVHSHSGLPCCRKRSRCDNQAAPTIHLNQDISFLFSVWVFFGSIEESQ